MSEIKGERKIYSNDLPLWEELVAERKDFKNFIRHQATMNNTIFWEQYQMHFK